MIAKLLRWAAKALLVIVLVAVAAVVAFRLAAFNRETGVRDVLAPSAGLVMVVGAVMTAIGLNATGLLGTRKPN